MTRRPRITVTELGTSDLTRKAGGLSSTTITSETGRPVEPPPSTASCAAIRVSWCSTNSGRPAVGMITETVQCGAHCIAIDANSTL